ncbi:MAG: hypothetical protein GY779_05495 [Gammaproteobacteria bacterium]|nr:hypothetical protein [Gammaproteobacteria bacterium]
MGNNIIITIYLRVIIEPFQADRFYLGDGEPVVDAIAVMTDHAVNTPLVGVTKGMTLVAIARTTLAYIPLATTGVDAEIVDRAPFAQRLPKTDTVGPSRQKAPSTQVSGEIHVPRNLYNK